jgi:DNA-binding MurR/RpiR family transcriptional regulator
MERDMIYDKLPIVLLSAAANEKTGSTNQLIASYLLDHISEIHTLSISALAKACHVSNSSISRFCKEIGLQDFFELKDLLLESSLGLQLHSQADSFSCRMQDYEAIVQKSVSQCARSISQESVQALCQDLMHYQNVYAFGLLKAQSVAFNFVCDMAMMQKSIRTSFSYPDQIESILQAQKEDLILIFSYTGSYFDCHGFRGKQSDLKRPKIWLIGSSQKQLVEYIDGCIYFESDHDKASHPYQLQFAAHVIVQEFARMQKQKQNQACL